MSDDQMAGNTLTRQDFLKLGGAAVAGAGLLGAAGCSGGGEIGGQQGGGGGSSVFTFGRGGPSVTLDPIHSTDSESSKVCLQVFDTLLGYKPGSTELAPALATEIPKPENGGLSYTFNLRKGVKFHDGTPFDADAVVFNFERWMNSKSPYHKGGGKQSSQFARYKIEFGGFDSDSNITKVEAVGSDAVRFTLKRPDGPFLNDIVIYTFAIASPKALKKDVENFWQHPVGTGPFKFVSWNRGSKITLEKNDDWWGTQVPVSEGGGGPHVNKLIFQDIPDNTSRVAALTGGDISAADGLNPDDVPTLRKSEDLRPVFQPPLDVGYLAMNCQHKPFDDKRVRLAVVYAINMPEIVKSFFGDSGELASNPIPSIVKGFAEDIKPYEYDPEKSKKLLKEAGLGGGFKTNLWYMPIPRPYMPNAKGIAQAMKADLKKVGIEAKLVTREWGTYIEQTGQGKHDMCLLGWSGANADPDTFINILLNGAYATKTNSQNVAYYKNPEMDKVLDKAARTVDEDERAKLYHRAQEIFHEDAPWAPVAYAKPVLGFQKSVKGFQPAPAGQRYNTVKIAG